MLIDPEVGWWVGGVADALMRVSLRRTGYGGASLRVVLRGDTAVLRRWMGALGLKARPGREVRLSAVEQEKALEAVAPYVSREEIKRAARFVLLRGSRRKVAADLWREEGRSRVVSGAG